MLPEAKWPEPSVPPTNNVVEVEVVKDPLLSTHTLVANHHTPLKNLEVIIDCKKFGTFQKLLRVTSYVLRFAGLLKQSLTPPLCDPSPSDLNTSELYWILSIQGKAFPAEIFHLKCPSQQRPIRVDQFNLFLDKDLVLKCKGRIGNANVSNDSKTPILLPSHHPLVDLLIRHIHIRIKHSGISDTLSTMRDIGS